MVERSAYNGKASSSILGRFIVKLLLVIIGNKNYVDRN